MKYGRRRMWLLDKMLRKMLLKGELVVTDYNGKVYRYGNPDPVLGKIVARLTDRKAAFDIATNPRLGAGETWMDGRMIIEEGDIRDLILMIICNAPSEDEGP